jgi:integrase/recombinase XerD
MTRTITPLRRRMLDDMRLRNMADGTGRSYVRSVAGFSAFHGRCAAEPSSMVIRARMVRKSVHFRAASGMTPL